VKIEMDSYKQEAKDLLKRHSQEDAAARQRGERPPVRNPLDWWKTNASKYPLLAVAARSVLCVPASSAPVERMFSSARVVGERRYSLKSEHLEALVMYHQNCMLRNPIQECLSH